MVAVLVLVLVEEEVVESATTSKIPENATEAAPADIPTTAIRVTITMAMAMPARRVASMTSTRGAGSRCSSCAAAAGAVPLQGAGQASKGMRLNRYFLRPKIWEYGDSYLEPWRSETDL